MAERHWVEIAGTVAIPLVGLLYTCLTAVFHEEQAERKEALAYVHDLSSQDTGTQAVATAMLTKLVNSPSVFDQFDGRADLRGDVLAMVNAAAHPQTKPGGQSDDEKAWANNASLVYGAWQKVHPEAVPGSEKTSAAPGVTVYVQYATDAEKDGATVLTLWLQNKGYYAPGIQEVASSPSKTQIRYFSSSTEAVSSASSLNEKLSGCGLQSSAKDWSSYPAANPTQIEIWLSAADEDKVKQLAGCLGISSS